MDKLRVAIGAIIVGLIVIGVAALLGGTLVWWFWPHFMPDIFPTAIESGAIAANPAWWKVVLFTWTCGILFKGSSSSSSSSSK